MNLSDIYVFKNLAATLGFTEAAEIDGTAERADNPVRGADPGPPGTVSFTISTAMGASLMPGLMTRFLPRWPGLKLNIQCDDQVKDIIVCNLHLAIRISSKLTDSKLITRRLTNTRKVLAASPRYLRERGTPANPTDLKKHRCLGFGNARKTNTTWTFRDGNRNVDIPMAFALSTNNELALILAACSHAGIIYVPEVCVAGELARNQLQIIPGFACPDPYGVYALYPHRDAAAKVKVLVDFIEDMLNSMDKVDRWTPLFDRLTEASDNPGGGKGMREKPDVA